MGGGWREGEGLKGRRRGGGLGQGKGREHWQRLGMHGVLQRMTPTLPTPTLPTPCPLQGHRDGREGAAV